MSLIVKHDDMHAIYNHKHIAHRICNLLLAEATSFFDLHLSQLQKVDPFNVVKKQVSVGNNRLLRRQPKQA